MINFTVEKMFILPDAGNLKAFADVCINDAGEVYDAFSSAVLNCYNEQTN